MKKSIFALLMLSTSTVQASDLCEGLDNPTVNLTFTDHNFSEDLSKSKRQITRMTSREELYHRDNALGLLDSRAHVQTKLDVGTMQRGSELCASHIANVTVSYDLTLYISKEVQRNQCALDFVRTHENEHVEIYSRFIEDNKENILEILENKYSDYVIGEPQTVRKDYQNLVVDIRKDVIAELEKVGDIHEAFDRSEFDETETVCRGALSRM